MTLKEVRTELLEQHEALRRLIADASTALTEWTRGEVPRERFRRALDAINEALESHNDREEALLRGVIAKVDAWGPAREEIMNERHLEEHEDLVGALIVAADAPDARAAAPVVAIVFKRILEHMGREESAFLRRDVLRDDDEPFEVDAFGG